MTATNFKVRRATIDDLEPLKAVWSAMKFSVEDLQNRLTEFQVAESADGKFIGAIGLQIAEKQGRIHSEGFTDFAFAEEIRPLLWERLQSVATNHGLFRLWTQERAPFWSRCGLTPAKEETLQKLPAVWRNSESWLALQLREDAAIEAISDDKEFEMFIQSEKERTARAFQQARVLKTVATIIALLLAGIVIIGGAFLMRNSEIFHKH